MTLAFSTPISFYPGPSQIYPQVAQYIAEGLQQNITGYNHRSARFVDIVAGLEQDLFEKLRVPKDYKLAFMGSATEVWGSLAHSFRNIPIHNFYNGDFGEKWFQINAKVNPLTEGHSFGLNEALPHEDLDEKEAMLIGLCQNETSNATQISIERLALVRKQYPEALIAVDATSSMAGIALDFSQADIWFASVQKCFGLPAGLCVVLMSPRVQSYLPRVDQSQYNNVVDLYEKAILHQTIHTPNVLNIYVLSRLLQDLPYIDEINAIVRQRAQIWRLFLRDQGKDLLSSQADTWSDTVMAVKGTESDIRQMLLHVAGKGMIIGKGYGKYAASSFRIANFPALTQEDIEKLQQILQSFWNKK